jgi:oligopeptidase B
LVKAPVADPDPKGWAEIIPHRSAVMLEGVLCFRDHYVLREREQGLPQLRNRDASASSDEHFGGLAVDLSVTFIYAEG